MQDDVAAVIVNFRTPEDAAACASSLLADTPGLRVLIVENGSGDDSADRLRAFAAGHPSVRVLVSPRNGGFGAGCNLGIDAALEERPTLRHVLLVNPDALAEPGMLAALRECAARHPDAGIVGGLVLTGDGSATWFENGAWKPWTLGGAHVPAPSGCEEYETQFVTGALMLIDAAPLRDGMRFDERFFLYCEDVDLCRQVVARGLRLRITRRARLRHVGGKSQEGEALVLGTMKASQLRWITRNKALLATKWLSGPQLWSCRIVAWVVRPAIGVVRYRQVRFLPLYFRALREGIAAASRTSAIG